MTKIIDLIKKYKEWIILVVLLLIAAISHGYNMFHFPYYTNDEGTYMSQAWSLLTEGKLAPYTYWYDHAPGGWMLIALWVKLTGGFFTFGASVNSGRVLMLILHVAIAWMLYYCTKKLSNSLVAGIIAVLIFSLSPLGIYFQRKVLLDNIMTFWLFASLVLLLRKNVKLTDVLISGLLFGIATLSKEDAIFFLPAFIYILYATHISSRRRFAITKWLAVSFTVISTYILYALLKGEFFPPGFLGNNTPHVSLIGSLLYQASRGTGLPFWNPGSDFYGIIAEAISRDAFSVILGAVSLLIAAILSIRIKEFRIPVFLSACFLAFLMRGGLVINFYIIPLLPILALCDGMVIVYVLKKITGKHVLAYVVCTCAVVAAIGGAFYYSSTVQYTRDETAPQIDAINWIKQNVPPDSYMAIDDYAYVDLHSARFPGDPVFPNADWFWKITNDPAVQTGKTHPIQYIMLGSEMLEQMNDTTTAVLNNAFNNSNLVVSWAQSTTAYINIPKRISTNGDWEMIYKVNTADEIQLETAWNYYKAHFITPEGNVVDASEGNDTTSEGQSYAMLRAVIVGDQSEFDLTWAWTQDHLEYRTTDKLFSWLWSKDPTTGAYKVEDPNTATDADEDIALSLVLASQKWNDPTYLSEAQTIIGDIWNEEVVEVNGHYYLASSVSSERPDGLLVDPSYISPASYRIFALVDPSHPWNTLSADSYAFLNELAEQPGDTSHLPANDVIVTPTGAIESAAQYAGSGADDYGFDSFRVLWRVALDYEWFNDPQAQQYLEKVSPFFLSEIRQNKLPGMVIDLKGNNITSPDSLSTDAGMVSALFVTDPAAANGLYSSIYTDSYNPIGYWGNDSTNYYAENWAWFMDALYTNQIVMPFPQLASSTYAPPVVVPDYNESDLDIPSAPVSTPDVAAVTTAALVIAPPVPVPSSTLNSPTPPQSSISIATTTVALPYAISSFTSNNGWEERWGGGTIASGTLSVTAGASNTSGGAFLPDSDSWTNYTVTADVTWVEGQEFSLIARRTDDADLVRCDFSNINSALDNIVINRTSGGQTVTMGDGELYVNTAAHINESDIKVSLRVDGDSVECGIDGAVVNDNINNGLPPQLMTGGIGFEVWDPQTNNSEIVVKDVSVTSL